VAILERYDPDIPEEVKEQMRGASFIDVPVRGPRYCRR
jgi:hypothetical protein